MKVKQEWVLSPGCKTLFSLTAFLVGVWGGPVSPLTGNVLLCSFSKDEIADSDCKTACGTPESVAPEILAGKLYYDGKASDIWSLGVLFFTILTGMACQISFTAQLSKRLHGHALCEECKSRRTGRGEAGSDSVLSYALTIRRRKCQQFQCTRTEAGTEAVISPFIMPLTLQSAPLDPACELKLAAVGTFPFSRPSDDDLDYTVALRKLFLRISKARYPKPSHISQ